MLAVDICRTMYYFSYNKLHYKFRMTYSDAEECCCKDGDGRDLPCGHSLYNSNFWESIEFSCTFHSNSNDMTTIDMTIFTINEKPFGTQSIDPIITLVKTPSSPS
jgi:hypothetical protein